MKFRIKYFFILFLMFSIRTFFAYGQIADTVKVDLKTPDGTGHADITVKLDNDLFNLHYSEMTDSNGVARFIDVPTPVKETDPMVLMGYRLENGYPNPVNDALFKIQYQVPSDATSTNVTLKVYDLLGREVKTIFSDEVSPGVYETAWDGTNNHGVGVADGVYLYSMETEDGVLANKIALVGSDGPRLSQRMNKLVNKPGSTAVNKQTDAVDYALSVNDSQGRFEGLNDNVVINGDTTFYRTMQELFNFNGPSQLSGNEGDTLGVAFDWFQYGTALDSLINESNQWQVVGVDQDSLFFECSSRFNYRSDGPTLALLQVGEALPPIRLRFSGRRLGE